MMDDQLLRRIRELERWRDGLVLPEIGLQYSEANTSNPPTQGQLTAAFGNAADVGAGFAGYLNDNGAGVNEYLVVSDGAAWWYVALTGAAVG